MSRTDTYIGTHTGCTSTGRRDPLYELEMCRALLAAAERDAKSNALLNATLISGLSREIEHWKQRATKDVVGDYHCYTSYTAHL